MRRALLIAFVLALGCLDLAAAQGDADLPAVLLSRQLMRDAVVKVGDTVVLAAEPDAPSRRFRVAGVYEPVPDPMKFNTERYEARLHLPDLIALTTDPTNPQAADIVTAINLKLRDGAAVDEVIRAVVRQNPTLIARPTARARQGDPFAALERFHVAIAAITLVGSTAFLLALMIIRAEERREMIGMLRLIGVSRRSIVLEILTEGVIVAILGALFGVALAAAAQYGINRFFQARYDTPLIFVQVTPSIALRCLAVSLPVGILTGAVASWTLLRRAPASLVGR
ncbi:MAG TPA: ABC transporter permease [Vicinamibacterales bacterium]